MITKYSLTPVFALLVVLLAAGCNEDDFLSYEPQSNYSVENFFETEFQATGAVNGAYTQLRELYNNALWRTVEMRSDNTTFIPNPNDRGTLAVEEIDYFVLTASSGIHGNIWGPAYRGISKTNYIIELIDPIPFADEADKLAKKGEASFLRAFYYYILTQSFGDAVKVTTIIESEAEAGAILELDRSPRAEVVNDIIIPDLEFAIENLPADWPSQDEGRATKAAAQMLLAKVYFADRNYAAALPLLNAIMDAGLYQISSDFRSLFGPGNQSNPEIIFANQFSVSANQGAGFFLTWLPYQSGTSITDGIFVASGASKNLPTQDLINAFEDGDRRFNATVGFYDEDLNDPDNALIPYSNKFLFAPVTQGGSDLNFPVFRYADVLLMKAEALLETQGGLSNEVFEIVNLLRVRAGLELYFPGNPNPDLNLSTEEELRQAVRRERRVELAYENHRWWDLMRYGNLREVMQAHGAEQRAIQPFLDEFPEAYQNIRELFAIPFNEVERYGYRQNLEWE